MDWLMCIMMIILFSAVLVLLWKNYRIKKEAKLFAEKVEGALDAIVTGKVWKKNWRIASGEEQEHN